MSGRGWLPKMPPGTTTLLSEAAEAAAPDPEEKARLDRARAVYALCAEAYRAGDLDARKFLALVRGAAELAGLREPGQRRWVGEAALLVIAHDPPKNARKNGQPVAFRRMAAGVARLANERAGLPLVRASKSGAPTAFDKAAEVMRLAGLPRVTARNVEKWHGEYHGSGESVE